VRPFTWRDHLTVLAGVALGLAVGAALCWAFLELVG
jgi:hypothetical protein